MKAIESALQAFNHQPLLNILIFTGLLVVTAFALQILLRNSFNRPEYKFSGRLFSEAEHSFFMTLHHAIGSDFRIFAKIRIADILTPDRKLRGGRRQSAFNQIALKHFDYVLCDKNTINVLAAIELDDESHESLSVQKRDIFVQKACVSAGLKLLRFKCKSGYNPENIRSQILTSLNSSTECDKNILKASLQHHPEPALEH